MPDQYTLEGFGQKIKAKYPQYKDVPDADLARKVLAKYPQYQSSIIPSAPAPRKTEDRTVGNYAKEIAHGVGRGVKDDAEGIVSAVKNPGRTALDFYLQSNNAVDKGITEFKDTKGAPMHQRLAAGALAGLENAPMLGPLVQRAEQGGESIASPEAAGAAAEGITAFAAPEVAGKAIGLAPKVGEAVTGGGKAVKDLVKDTREENAGISVKNEKLKTDRTAEVKAHGDKLSDVRKAEEKRSGAASRKSALETGVKTLSDKFQEDLKATRDKARDEANAKYAAVNEALGNQSIPSSSLLGHLLEASEKIKGSMTNPTIFKDIEKAVKEGDSISYDDLQGYYSELGRELSKGTLPGDIYTAYNTLQEAIGGEMQQIADKNGLGPQLTDARTSWRNLKQTFYDPKSPLRRAINTKEAGDAVRALLGKDRTGIQALAKYDPQLAARGNVIRGYMEEANATKVPAASTKATPQLAPRKPAVPTKKIGVEDIREAKGEKLNKGADRVRQYTAYAATWPLLYVLKDVVRGHAPNVGQIGLESAATLAAGHGIANILEKPSVRKFFTEPTARDIASIPEDLRGDMPALVKAAQDRGIKVSPLLVRATQGTAFLAPRKQENPTDAWAQQ